MGSRTVSESDQGRLPRLLPGLPAYSALDLLTGCLAPRTFTAPMWLCLRLCVAVCQGVCGYVRNKAQWFNSCRKREEGMVSICEIRWRGCRNRILRKELEPAGLLHQVLHTVGMACQRPWMAQIREKHAGAQFVLHQNKTIFSMEF